MRNDTSTRKNYGPRRECQNSDLRSVHTAPPKDPTNGALPTLTSKVLAKARNPNSLEFRAQGFGAQADVLKASAWLEGLQLGFRVQGLGFRELGFRV